MAPPHPALRVPVPGDGAGVGSWDDVVSTPDGVPLLLADPAAYLARVGGDAAAPLDAVSYEGLCVLSRYLPLLEAPDAPMRVAVRDLLRRHAPARARLGVEAACSVGPDLASLRAVCDAVIAFDGHVVAARAARAWVAGEAIPRLTRVEGRSFLRGPHVHGEELGGVTIVVGDALDPPLHAEAADVVVALNLLDIVAEPLNLIGQLDAILAPGGLLVLASPFCWNDGLTAPEQQLGGGTIEAFATMGTADGVKALLTGATPLLPHLRFAILEEREAEWTLRDHARATFTYTSWIVAARKAPTPAA